MNSKKQLDAITKELKNLSNDGRIGRAKEIERARAKSRKNSVSAQGKIDVFVKFTANNKRGFQYVACESKINGGRVDDLLNGKNKSKYVIYSLDFNQKHKASKKHDEYIEVRHIDDVIIPTKLFVAKLIEFNAIKEVAHGGVVDGIAIQPSNKKWYEWLSDYPVKFDNENAFEEWEFEGLE